MTTNTFTRHSTDQSITRADVYTRVTDQIIQAIEAGTEDWNMPWHTTSISGCPRNAATGNAYRGVNILSLWAVSHMNGYPEGIWATVKQWNDLNRTIKRGERAAVGVFWKPIDIQQFGEAESDSRDDHSEAEANRTRWIARAFPLFNIAQLDGYQPPEQPERPGHQRIVEAEAFVAALGADVRHGGNRAFYRSSSDHIQMPPFDVFLDPIAYYGTLLHEATHWCGAKSRLDRDLSGRFGSEAYAAEELIAELGTSFVCADLGIAPEPRPENAAYINNWLSILKADKRAIFTASTHAQRAADYLHGLQSSPILIHGVPSAPALDNARHSLCL